MRTPLQIAFHDVHETEAIKELIEEKTAWLERFFARITACRVVVEHLGQGRGARFGVRIDLSVPGDEIVVHREMPAHGTERHDLPTAIRDAFDVVRRRLEDYARQLRNTHEPSGVTR